MKSPLGLIDLLTSMKNRLLGLQVAVARAENRDQDEANPKVNQNAFLGPKTAVVLRAGHKLKCLPVKPFVCGLNCCAMNPHHLFSYF
jgi:hypothetical protein